MNEALPPHLSALGFVRNPFPQTPDADCYFRTEALEQQFAEALHCLQVGKGFVLLTGEVGTGKSTFLRCLMDELIETDAAVSFVFNTFLQGRDLLLAINRDFGLTPGSDLAQDIEWLNQYLIAQHVNGRRCVVVIDDAQNLDAASLELLRLLSNLETRQEKLLQIVLSGQPELLALLRKNEIRQLASRIVQHIQLSPLSGAECERYISFRITRSGTHGRIRLGAAAQRAVHRHARGNPRRVHLIMDRCLYGVAPSGSGEVSKSLIDQAARESGISRERRRLPVVWSLLGAATSVVIGLAAWLGLGLSAAKSVPEVVPVVVTSSEPLTQSTIVPTQSEPGPLTKMALTTPNKAGATPAEPGDLDACLKALPSMVTVATLVTGPTGEPEPAALQMLAKDGLILSAVPLAAPWPEGRAGQTESPCRWSQGANRWMVWRPTYFPFELTDGARGESVRWLQTRLTEQAVYTVPVDGMAGWRTLAALNVFQHQNGVSALSAVDGWTLFLLERGAKAPAM
jgi:general secretion pathway protein A